MSVDQLVEEVEKLTDAERQLLFLKLNVHAGAPPFEESPEFIAFVEEGIRSAEKEPLIPLEDAIKEFESWNTKSS